MSNHMIDTIGTPMRGEFFVRGINRAGEIVFTFEDNNMIVTAAKETLANLIGGDSAGKNITNIAFGNSNATPAPDNDSVGGVETDSLTMGANMSGTTMVAYMKSITSHSYPQAGRVPGHWISGKRMAWLFRTTALSARISLCSPERPGALSQKAGTCTWTVPGRLYSKEFLKHGKYN